MLFAAGRRVMPLDGQWADFLHYLEIQRYSVRKETDMV